VCQLIKLLVSTSLKPSINDKNNSIESNRLFGQCFTSVRRSELKFRANFSGFTPAGQGLNHKPRHLRRTSVSIQQQVQDYYGKTLQGSEDLKTNACWGVIDYSTTVTQPLSLISDDASSHY